MARTYEDRKAAEAARNRQQARAGRDIGEIPAAAEPARRAAAERDFRRFCLAYFHQAFPLPFSPDHLKVIARIEQSVLEGGLFALAMPRGSGKTTLCEVACLWAILYGHRGFVCFIGATSEAARRSLETLKAEVETNEVLQADFPEVCYPIEQLERIVNRCKGQTCGGAPTYITWTADEIVLPSVPGSRASAAVVKVAGITGAIRGMKVKRPGGASVRPDLVVIDDPQTDESANSESQCATRERTLAGAILGLAGPGKKIAGIMPLTVIREGDAASNVLDRKKHPEWNGERCKLIYQFPTNEALWAEYAEVRAESFRRGDAGREATEFYRQRRAAMDAGAVVAWPERFLPDELSAVQHALNLKLTDEHSFAAEYQNEPIVVRADDAELTADQIAGLVNRHARRLVPRAATRLTAMIDVHAALLYYAVVAWDDGFGGAVVDYGTFPDQKRPYFTLRDAKPTLQTATKAAGLEGQLHAGLTALAADLLGREWPRDDGTGIKVERCLIDANWGQSTDLVYQFCRQSAWAAALIPSHGKFVGASSQPLTARKKKPGERFGLNWIMPLPANQRKTRYVLFDANFWKSFVHARLGTAAGDRGALALFGDKPAAHRLFAEHLTAEYRVKTESRGRHVDEWKARPHKPDNHWLDCLVGAAVAASLQGAGLADLPTDGAPKARKRVSYADMQREARARRGA